MTLTGLLADLDYSEATALAAKISRAGTKFYGQAATIMDIAYHHTAPLSDVNRTLYDQADRYSAAMNEMHALAEDLEPAISAAFDRYLARTSA